jgi:hypothetical protein
MKVSSHSYNLSRIEIVLQDLSFSGVSLDPNFGTFVKRGDELAHTAYNHIFFEGSWPPLEHQAIVLEFL